MNSRYGERARFVRIPWRVGLARNRACPDGKRSQQPANKRVARTMNKNSNNRRSRGRGGNKRHGNVRNQTFESNGPGVKVRGTAQQVLDKYLALARDASSSGDRIMAESYFQFAEHYFRLLNTDEQRNAERNGQNNRRGNGRDRMDTPGSAEGGPEDLMAQDDYDDDSDGDGDDDDSGAEVTRVGQAAATVDHGDDQDDDDQVDVAAEQPKEQKEAKPARAPRTRRKKAPEAQQAELPMDAQAQPQAQPAPQPEQAPKQAVETDAAD